MNFYWGSVKGVGIGELFRALVLCWVWSYRVGVDVILFGRLTGNDFILEVI